MSRPRTREHFPRMKVRGGRRRLHARIEQTLRGLHQPIAKLSQAFVRIEVDVRAFADAMDRIACHINTAVLAANWLARRRARDQWLSRRMLTATPSPWAAPLREEAL